MAFVARIAYSADCVLFLYSEQSPSNGGKAPEDPWTLMLHDDTRPDLAKKLHAARSAFPTGKSDYVSYCVLEIAKNRSGRRGDRIPLLYQKAYHRFSQAI